MSNALVIKESLEEIPNFLYPNNPGKEGFFSVIGTSHLSSLITWLSPIALAMNWINTIRSFKHLYQAENRNFMLYADAIVSFTTSLGWTALTFLGMGASAYVLAHVVPIIAIGVFALNTLYCLFNFGKNLYYALTAENKNIRNQYLWNAGKQLLGIVTNVVCVDNKHFSWHQNECCR